MPREGQTSVTMKTYVWEKVDKHWTKRKAYFKKKGIHSPSALIEYWIEEKLSLEQS